MTGPIIPSSAQAKAMRYVEFPKIKHPHAFTMYPTTLKRLAQPRHLHQRLQLALQPQIQMVPHLGYMYTRVSQPKRPRKQSKQTAEPVVPQIKWNADSIELNGKVQKLPITKDYMLREYIDIFKGIGTLPGGPYHIRLKEQYRLVQRPPWSVPVAMQSAYRAELNRLVNEGIITEVKEHIEWINSIVPVMKSNGSQFSCAWTQKT